MDLILENQNVIKDVNSLIYIFLSCFIFGLGLFISKNYLMFFFGICQSNEKTSIKHLPMIRGLGVWYLLSLMPFFFLNFEIFKLSEWVLLVGSVIIGFWDDKRGITQKKKLIVLFILWFLSEIILFDSNLSSITSYNSSFFLRLLLFIFFILFFNQIDGINGLASLTFLVFTLTILLFLNINKIIIIFYISSILMVMIYLIVNLRGKIGIQGESGSFFMGALSYLLVINNFLGYQVFYSIFLLCPILLDLVITSIYLFLKGKNLFKGHRENIYQKLTSKFQSHAIVSFGFTFLQIISSIYVIYFWNNGLLFDKKLYLTGIFMLTSFILYKIRLQINNSDKP